MPQTSGRRRYVLRNKKTALFMFPGTKIRFELKFGQICAQTHTPVYQICTKPLKFVKNRVKRVFPCTLCGFLLLPQCPPRRKVTEKRPAPIPSILLRVPLRFPSSKPLPFMPPPFIITTISHRLQCGKRVENQWKLLNGRGKRKPLEV